LNFSDIFKLDIPL